MRKARLGGNMKNTQYTRPIVTKYVSSLFVLDSIYKKLSNNKNITMKATVGNSFDRLSTLEIKYSDRTVIYKYMRK